MILGVIPARYGSSRFPGKPLADIAGYPMIWHVYQRCLEAEVCNQIVIATEDHRILQACRDLGLEAIQTADHHRDCLDRVAEVAESEIGVNANLIVTVQGDEPFVPAASIRCLVESTWEPDGIACGCAEITDPADFVDASIVKVALDDNGCMAYMSRAPVPAMARRTHVRPLFQVCVYGHMRDQILAYAQMPPTALEKTEGIGLLRYIGSIRKVRMVPVEPSPLSVDTPADLERAQEYYGVHRKELTRA